MKGVKIVWTKLSNWYGKYYTQNVGIASFLFIWQLAHLYWLTFHVVFLRLFHVSFFNLSGFWQYLIIIADYVEIPALIFTSFVYIHALSKKFSWKSILFLIMLNSQWIHLFWLTDEFVLRQLTPIWLAWVAIFIDYLELPVIYDTLKKFFASLRKKVYN